jgi:hypothetical protein
VRSTSVQTKSEGIVTASPREQSPTPRGRQTKAAIDAAARAVIARKGFLAATISDIPGAHRLLDDARDPARAADRLAATIKRAQREGYCVDDETGAT